MPSMHRRFRLLPVMVLCGVLQGPRDCPAESPAEVMAGLQRRYASVRSVTAQFEQQYQAPGVNQRESGTFWMKKPGLMRWEYRIPEVKLFIGDGRDTWLYLPEDRQVLVRSFTEADLHSTPLQFLLGRGEITRSFKILPESETRARIEGTVLVRLEPTAPEPDYAFLVLEVDSRSYDLRRIVIRERTGNTSEFLLTDLRVNENYDDRRFRFQIPKGAEVVRLDEK